MKISELTTQLQQESDTAMQQVKQMQQSVLEKLKDDLERQCSSASSTLRSALDTSNGQILEEIETRTTVMRNAVLSESQELSTQVGKLRSERATLIAQTFWALRMMIVLPVAGTALLCVAMIFLTWIWMPRGLWNMRTDRMTAPNGRSFLVIESPGWEICNISSNAKEKVYRPCKELPSKP